MCLYIILLFTFISLKTAAIITFKLFGFVIVVFKAVDLVERRNKYIKHLPNAYRFNLINYPGELRYAI